MEMHSEREGEEEEERAKKMASKNPDIETPRKGKSCKGALYFSSHLKSKGLNPRCVGITRTIQQVPKYIISKSEVKASEEGRSLTDFKYACVGYSIYLDKNKETPSNEDQKPPTELPVCVGIQLLVDKKPSDHHAPAHAHVHNREDDRTHPQLPQPKPTHQLGDEFLTRFSRNAGLVASGVARNMQKVGNYVKESIDDILYKRPK